MIALAFAEHAKHPCPKSCPICNLKWPTPKPVEKLSRRTDDGRSIIVVPKWWPSNRQIPIFIDRGSSSWAGFRFFVGLTYSFGLSFETLPAACAHFDTLLGFNAACVAFALSHKCIGKKLNGEPKWVRR